MITAVVQYLPDIGATLVFHEDTSKVSLIGHKSLFLLISSELMVRIELNVLFDAL